MQFSTWRALSRNANETQHLLEFANSFYPKFVGILKPQHNISFVLLKIRRTHDQRSSVGVQKTHWPICCLEGLCSSTHAVQNAVVWVEFTLKHHQVGIWIDRNMENRNRFSRRPVSTILIQPFTQRLLDEKLTAQPERGSKRKISLNSILNRTLRKCFGLVKIE